MVTRAGIGTLRIAKAAFATKCCGFGTAGAQFIAQLRQVSEWSTSTMDADLANNSKVWSDSEIVAEYESAVGLQPPESAILAQLRSRLAGMKMLDIGVGAGRTMLHFAPAVQQYCGIDYSAAMISACRRRRPRNVSHITLLVCDARAMTPFPNGFFDFIYFSYNGIDYVSHQDRVAIFAEVKRIGAPGGFFCFSSHNLQDLQHLRMKIRKGGGLVGTITNVTRWATLRFRHNRILSLTRLRRLPYALINDGAHRNRLLTYYIRPADQIEQLAPFFRDIQAFRLSDGARLRDADELYAVEDPWIYYLCRVRK